MSEQYTTGVVVTGKVTGIQDYGAFVALDAETQGLVHISEITNGYVKDIHDFLKVGDTVEVKVLSLLQPLLLYIVLTYETLPYVY
ncbi:S1 RNA-binding domain-containing protein, partial [Bacillus sp. D-CC]